MEEGADQGPEVPGTRVNTIPAGFFPAVRETFLILKAWVTKMKLWGHCKSILAKPRV